MTPAFDPYNEWLNILGSCRPPKDYELLGLTAGEPDADRIQAAYQERYEFVRKYQNGRHSEAAQRILRELSCASESMKAAALQCGPQLERYRADAEPYEAMDLTEILALLTDQVGRDVELYEVLDRAAIVSAFVGTKQSTHSTSNTNPVASSPEYSQVDTATQQAYTEVYSVPTDEQRPAAEHDLFTRLVTGLAVASGIITIWGIWLPYVAVYFGSLAIVFGCWHFVNAFHSPPCRELHRHISTWVKAQKCHWSAQRAVSATTAIHRRLTKEVQLRIESLVDQRSALPSNKKGDLDNIRNKERETQLHSFLGTYTIRNHLNDIPYVGPERLNALESCGIKTANDVQYERVVSINGFGAVIAASLVNWRSNLTRRFSFDAEAIPKQALLVVEQNYAQQEQHLDGEIKKTIKQLRVVNETSQRELAPMLTTLREAANERNQAWTLVQRQLSPTTSFVVVVLTAFLIPTLVFFLHVLTTGY